MRGKIVEAILVSIAVPKCYEARKLVDVPQTRAIITSADRRCESNGAQGNRQNKREPHHAKRKLREDALPDSRRRYLIEKKKP